MNIILDTKIQFGIDTIIFLNKKIDTISYAEINILHKIWHISFRTSSYVKRTSIFITLRKLLGNLGKSIELLHRTNLDKLDIGLCM